MEAVGIGQDAVRRAAAYARQRIVFDRPIGQNQGVQHPLAESWMELEAASLVGLKAAWLYDRGRPCGAQANAAKFLGAEAALRACERAVRTHGGMGYAKEFHVERLLREVMISALGARQLADDPQLHRRAGPGPTPIILSHISLSHITFPLPAAPAPAFRGG